MPITDASDYRVALLARGPHWETILPNISRRRLIVRYERHRLELPDGDFLDLDWMPPTGQSAASATNRCLLALHGLEGDARAPYIKSFARAATARGYGFAALNLRGCSGALNRLPRFYHSGETGDVRAAVAWLRPRCGAIGLVGFSLGGNVALKFMAEGADGGVRAAVAYSAPIDLAGSARRLDEAGNRFYMRRFIRLLSSKIEAKARVYPEFIDADGCRGLRNFAEFDGRYTAPLNGFASAEDYWRRCSALPLLPEIRTPSLLINARNDPFLSASCFPEEAARRSAFFHAAFPERGGHIGFPGRLGNGECWHERLGLDFLDRNWVG